MGKGPLELQRLLAAQRDKQGGVLVPADQWDDMQNLLANKKAELDYHCNSMKERAAEVLKLRGGRTSF